MNKFEKYIIKELKSLTKQEVALAVPPDPKLGDYSFPCFPLAKVMKKDPKKIAEELASKFKKNHLIKEVKTVGPYLNFYVNKDLLVEEVLGRVDKDYGKGEKKKEKVMIEYHQPNTHKGLHIGHLRNAVLGDALIRIMRYDGYKVIAASYIGDIGAHVAKCIWYYLKFHKGKEPKENKGEWIGEIYTEATKYVEKHETAKEEIDKTLQKLEAGNKKLKAIWMKTRKWSLDEFERITKELDLNVDKWFYESEVEQPGKKYAQELLKEGIAEVSDGAVVINLEKYGLKVFLILKSDGSSLYSTKDLELARKKFKEFKIDKSIYVVAAPQSFYFQQLFKALEVAGFKQAKKCYHLCYELVMLSEGKMSSRHGNVILYTALLEEIREKASEEVTKRHKDWKKDRIKKSVDNITFGALKFAMLNQDNNKVITFDTDKALDFEGETGPYIQYSHARINSILKKAKVVPKKVDYSLLNSPEELRVVNLVAQFPEVVEKIAESYRPSLMCRYLLDLSQAFNEFYHKAPVIKAEPKLRDARLELISKVKLILGRGLELSGIAAPEEM
ncbi:arginine--tRNA ligase [Candidatus Woesearchaeota archaeon]|nr:arginine--tRNA ligase [Candidatus Woesearchaeota archaeon]